MGHTWDNFSMKIMIIMDYHWLTEVRNYELTLINKYKYKQTGWKEISSLLKNNIYFFSIYLQLHWAFVAAQGLFSGCGKRVTFPCGAEASVVASLFLEHRLWEPRLQQLWLTSLKRGLSSYGAMAYFAACEIFPDQGSNQCPLHWQVDSYPLYHQEVQ